MPALAAAGSAIFGYQSARRAQKAEASALQTRQMAETARGEAEKLMVYLLEDFTRELDPVGRLDIVANLARRALDYYRELPEELRHSRHRAQPRTRARALRRGAQEQGDLAGALVPLEDAEAVFNRLRAQGDSRKCWWSGWPPHCSCVPRSSVPRKCFRRPSQPGMPASALLRPLAAMPDATLNVQRGLGESLRL